MTVDSSVLSERLAVGLDIEGDHVDASFNGSETLEGLLASRTLLMLRCSPLHGFSFDSSALAAQERAMQKSLARVTWGEERNIASEALRVEIKVIAVHGRQGVHCTLRTSPKTTHTLTFLPASLRRGSILRHGRYKVHGPSDTPDVIHFFPLILARAPSPVLAVWLNAVEALWDCYVFRPTPSRLGTLKSDSALDEKMSSGGGMGLQVPRRLVVQSLDEWASRRLGALSARTEPPSRPLELTWSLARKRCSEGKPCRDLQSISVSIEGTHLDRLLQQVDGATSFSDMITRHFSTQTGMPLADYPLMRVGFADGNLFLGGLEGRLKLLPDLPGAADQCDLKRWIIEELTYHAEEFLLR